MEKKESNGLNLAFNPVKFIKLCFKYWPVFVLSVILCTGLAYLYTKIKTPVVDVEAQLMLKEDVGTSGSMIMGEIARSFSLGDMFGGSSSTDNEANVLRSHTVFLQTAKALDLNETYLQKLYGFKWRPMQLTSPVRIIAPAEMPDTLTTTLIFNLKRNENGKYDINLKKKRKVLAEAEGLSMPFNFKTPYGTFAFDYTSKEAVEQAKDIDHMRILYSSYAAAAESYASLVKIFVPDRKSDFIGLSVQVINPKFGEALLDTIIEKYTNVGNDYKVERSKQSLALVNERLSSLSQELTQSEAALEKFKKDNNITDVEIDAQYLITKTGEIESSLLQAQTEYEVVKLTRDFINNPENNYSLIPELYVNVGKGASQGGEGSSQIAQYNQLILKRMELLTTAKPTSNPVKQIDEQIDALRRNIISSVNRAYENSSVQLRDLKSENSRTQSKIGTLPTLERQYINIKRDNLLQEQLYLFLLQQREELNMSLTSRSLPAQVIDKAHAITMPSGLTPTIIVLAGAFLGLLFAMAYVFFFKMRKAAISSESEFRNSMKAPIIGSLKSDKNATLALALDNDNPNSENLRQLRTDVENALRGCDGNIIAVTSMHPQEGKSFVAVNLAASLAKIGKNVLIVDTALRNPAVAQTLGLSPAASLEAYVMQTDNSPVEIQTVNIDKKHTLDVITADVTDANAADIIGADDTIALFKSLKDKYDYIIIDASPITGCSEIGYVTDIADVTMIVCRAKKVSSLDIEKINEAYTQGRYKRIAILANSF